MCVVGAAILSKIYTVWNTGIILLNLSQDLCSFGSNNVEECKVLLQSSYSTFVEDFLKQKH
jgi:hypothetical protein